MNEKNRPQKFSLILEGDISGKFFRIFSNGDGQCEITVDGDHVILVPLAYIYIYEDHEPYLYESLDELALEGFRDKLRGKGFSPIFLKYLMVELDNT